MAGVGVEAGFLSSGPFRFQEKGNLEVLLFSIQSKLRACNRRLYVPREGCGIWDIDKETQPEATQEFSYCNPALYRCGHTEGGREGGKQLGVSTQSARAMSKLQDPVRRGA